MYLKGVRPIKKNESEEVVQFETWCYERLYLGVKIKQRSEDGEQTRFVLGKHCRQ